MQNASVDQSLEGLMSFLDYVRNKGLMNSETVGSYRTACNKVFSICDPEELLDVTQIDLDKLFQRFSNLNTGSVRPATMRTYSNRVQTAMSEFQTYIKDPMNWEPSITVRGSRSSAKTDKGNARSETQSVSDNGARKDPESTTSKPGTYPFPLRPDVTVEISNIPIDMTVAESMRLSAFIYTLAIDFQPNSAWSGPQLVLPTSTIDG